MIYNVFVKKKKIFLKAILIVVTILVVGYVLFQVSKSRSFQFFGEIIPKVHTTEKVIALTFDDAPSKYSNEVVDILNAKGIKATFYAIGRNIEQYPEEAKYIVGNGNEIGNHSYSHQRFLLKSQSFIDSEVQKTNALIRSTGYKGDITFRPPNGKKLFGLPWYLNQHGIKTITWDVEPDTFLPPAGSEEEKTKYLIDYTVNNTKPGSIILLHPCCGSCGSDRKAIGQIIDKLQSMGYKFVTVSELLKYDGMK